MKVAMCRVTIYGNQKQRKAVLEYLQRQQVLDIAEPDAEDEDYGFSRVHTGDARSEFLREQTNGVRALDILDTYAPQKKGMLSSLEGRKTLSAKEYYQFVDDIPEMRRIAHELLRLDNEIGEKKGQIVRCRTTMEELQPWKSLDVPIDTTGTTETAWLIGTFPAELSAAELMARYMAQGTGLPPIYAEVIQAEPQQTYALILCRKGQREVCENALRSVGFSRPKATYHGVPLAEIEAQQRQITALEQEITDLTQEICSYVGARNALRFLCDYYAMREEKYGALGKLSQLGRVFVLTGYAPAEQVPDLAATLEHKFHTAVEFEPAGAEAPVLLRNNYFAQPVEGIVKTFALPRPHEIDPTSIMAWFYYIFFGLMLSDAGYGFLMVLGCGWALCKFKNMEEGMRKTLRMFLYSGVSTIFWGVLFGGYFGDAISVISSTFFGHEVTIPALWFEPVNDPMKMLMFSFLFGLIHLFTGLGIQLYQLLKAKNYSAAFSDCICWFLLIGGGVLYLFHVDMFLSMAGISGKLPTVWANVAAIAAGVGALGILLCTAKSGGILKRLAKGAYALYGVTSWLSDILSYSRLLALGLATGVIATVFNKMGSMFGDGILGAVIFLVVFVIGHALNIGVNLLGAYVHTNRLQFVEFFGKFYEGGGTEFQPFSAHTKYYKFQQEKL